MDRKNSDRNLRDLVRVGRAGTRLASSVAVAADLLWIPQALILATVVGDLAALKPVAPGWGAFAAFAGLAVARAGLSAISSRLAFEAAVAVKADIRERLAARLGSWSPLDGRRPTSGEAAALGADHVETLDPYLSHYQPARTRLTVVPLVILLATAFYSWIAALILLIAGPLIPVFMAIIGMRAKDASDRQLEAILGINAYLADRLAGLQDLRILRAARRAGEDLEAHAFDLKRATMAVLRIAFLSSAVLELFSALGVAFVAVYVGFSLLGYFDIGAWGGGVELRGGLFVLILAPEFFAPLRNFAASYHDRASALAAADALTEVLEAPFASRAEVYELDRSVAPGSVILKGVGYTYGESGKPAVDDFSLTVTPGERVALTGPSGAGKSTLLALVAGLARPDSGNVVHGGETAPRVAWISQTPHFLNTSLRQNLTLGREGRSDDDLRRAVENADASDVLARMPAGFATLLGESGQGISGGEGQRMALARAFLTDADVILADEPTAHLDRETAVRVIDRLLALAEGRTLIVATHDFALAGRMDRQVPLASGVAA